MSSLEGGRGRGRAGEKERERDLCTCLFTGQLSGPHRIN